MCVLILIFQTNSRNQRIKQKVTSFHRCAVKNWVFLYIEKRTHRGWYVIGKISEYGQKITFMKGRAKV